MRSTIIDYITIPKNDKFKLDEYLTNIIYAYLHHN